MTTLTDKLTTPGPITLDDTERAAVAAAFAELARSAAVRATHESLLASFGRDARDVVRAVDDAFARMTNHADDRAAEQSAVRDTLASARAALTAEVQASTDLRSLIAAAVRFAFAVALPT